MSLTVRRVLLALGGIAFCLLAFRLAFTRSFEFGVAEYVRGFLHALPAPFVTTVLSHLPVNEDPAAWIVRKAASIVFFGVVGALARALAGRRISETSTRAWLVVGAATLMSAAVEIYEWPEPIGDVAFDLVCGVAGGVVAALILRLFRRL